MTKVTAQQVLEVLKSSPEVSDIDTKYLDKDGIIMFKCDSQKVVRDLNRLGLRVDFNDWGDEDTENEAMVCIQ